ncbi:MAG: hypothetical protein V1827_04710 [Candidatus Micrarchaeota archaeon]
MKLKQDDSRKRREGPGIFRRMKEAAFAGALSVAILSACGESPKAEPPDGGNRPDAALDGGKPDAGPDSSVYRGPAEPCGYDEHLIGDHLDRRNCDRQSHEGEEGSHQGYPLGEKDTSYESNPFTDGISGSIGPDERYLFRISADDEPGLEDVDVYDPIVGKEYVARQDVWVRGNTGYDPGIGEVIGTANFVAYSLTFDGPDGEEIGIPICTLDGTILGDYSACKRTCGNYVFASESHMMEFEILGERWMLTNTTPPVAETESEDELVPGGSIRIGKEETSAMLTSGQSFSSGPLTFLVDHFEGNTFSPTPMVQVIEDGTPLYIVQAIPGQTLAIPTGGQVKNLHAFSVTGAYDINDSVVHLAVLSDELEIVHGSDIAPGMKALLGWKNYYADPYSRNIDAFRKLVIYSDDIAQLSTGGSGSLLAGDSILFGFGSPGWGLSYEGLDITDEDRSALGFRIIRTDRILPKGPSVLGGMSQCAISAPFLEATSASPAAFKATRSDTAGELSDDRFIVVLSNGGGCESAGGSIALAPGSVLMKESPASDRYGLADPEGVAMPAIGSGSYSFSAPDGGRVAIEAGAEGKICDLVGSAGGDCSPALSPDGALIGVSEYAGAKSVGYHIFGVSQTADASEATFLYDSEATSGISLTSSEGSILYGHASRNPAPDHYSGSMQSGPVDSGLEMVGPGHVSERGSLFKSITKDAVELMMSNKLAKAIWGLRKSGE